MGIEVYQDQVERAYVAYYGRPAEAAGLAFWEDALSRVGGDPAKLINDFGHSTEATSYYAGMNVSQQINKIYNLMFNRDAEPTGLNYWVDLVSRGGATPASIMLEVANGAQANDKAILDNKVAVSDYFTADISANPDHAAWYSAHGDTIHTWLSKIDSTAASVTLAKSNLALLFSGQDLYGTGTTSNSNPLLAGFKVISSSVTNQMVTASGTPAVVSTGVDSRGINYVKTTTGADVVYNDTSTTPVSVGINAYAEYQAGGPYNNFTFNGGPGTAFVTAGFGDNVLIGGSGAEYFSIFGGHTYVKPGRGGDTVDIQHPAYTLGTAYTNAPDSGVTIDLNMGGAPGAYDSKLIRGFVSGKDKIVLDKSLVVSNSTTTDTSVGYAGTNFTLNTDTTGLLVLTQGTLTQTLAGSHLTVQGSHGAYILNEYAVNGANQNASAFLYYVAPGDTQLTLVGTLQPNGTQTLYSASDFMFG